MSGDLVRESLELLETGADNDDALMPSRRQSRESWTLKRGGLFAGLIFAGAMAALLWSRSTRSFVATLEDEDSYSEKLEVAGVGGKACVGPMQDCSACKCCNVTGYKCYLSSTKGPVCLDSIAVGASSSPKAVIKMAPKPGDSRPSDLVLWDKSVSPPEMTLFCFEVYAKDTGSTKKDHSLELIEAQYQQGTSIFACDDKMVFSDVPITIGGAVKAVVIDMPHLEKRKSTGSWVNSPAFQSAWSYIKDDGRWANFGWTVKVDPDAVFLPDRLRLKLSGQKVSESGVYFTNCEHVSFGLFGSIEVISKNAVGNLLANLDTCKNNPEINNVTYGEDLFAQKCMNSVGVSNIEDFYVVTDGVCDAIAVQAATKAKKKVVHLPDCTMGTAAFHPLKTVPAYLKCLSAAQQHQR